MAYFANIGGDVHDFQGLLLWHSGLLAPQAKEGDRNKISHADYQSAVGNKESAHCAHF